MRYVIRIHFVVSNNFAEYEALVNGLRITVELGVRCLDVRGDSQLVIDQVVGSHYRPIINCQLDSKRRRSNHIIYTHAFY